MDGCRCEVLPNKESSGKATSDPTLTQWILHTEHTECCCLNSLHGSSKVRRGAAVVGIVRTKKYYETLWPPAGITTACSQRPPHCIA